LTLADAVALFGATTTCPKGITPEDAKFLQECAQKVVDAFPHGKNNPQLKL